MTAGKIQVGDWIQELKLSGDFRLRNQWDEHTPMVLTNPAFKNQDIEYSARSLAFPPSFEHRFQIGWTIFLAAFS